MNGEDTPAESTRGAWGPFATIAFAVLVAALFVLAQIAVAIPYLILQVAGSPGPNFEDAAAGLESDGLFFSLAEVIAGSFAIGFILFLAWIRKGPSVRDYLALRPASRATTLQWLLYVVLLGVLLDAVSYALGYAVVPPWMQAIYRSAVYIPLLLVAMVVVAPVVEELFFRAFLFEGCRDTRLGDPGVIALTSLAWACIHLQYEWFYIGQIFVLGALLGVARSRTRSVVPSMLMHSLFNGIASLQVILDSGS
jgi:hypothetical protein